MCVKSRLAGVITGVTLVLGLASSAHATNLLLNGSFETGDFTDWTLGGNTDYLGVTTTFEGVSPQNGTYEVYAGSVGSDVSLSQTFSDIAGKTYTASGWVYGFGGSPSDFGMQIDGVTSIYINPYPASGWTEYSFTFTGTGSDTLNILNRNDPSYQVLDNFSVVSATPLPSTWTMLIAGFAGLGFFAYRGSKKNAAAIAAA